MSYTVTIVSNPDGTPVSGSNNTFDYPILSSVTLTCMVTSSDGSTPTELVTNYQWDTTGCYTNTAHNSGNPTCFPTGQTTQSVTENDLTAEDAGTITCTITIGHFVYISEPFTLRISGKMQHNIICDPVWENWSYRPCQQIQHFTQNTKLHESNFTNKIN